MDALTVLRREHTRIEQLFIEFDSLSDRACAGRAALMREIDALVRRHVGMEEALIYHALEKEHGDRTHELELRLLDRISGTNCRDPKYVALAHELHDALRRHMEEEEAHVFPAFSAAAGSTAA